MKTNKIVRGLTVGGYLWACFIDLVSSLALLNKGFTELNPLYAILGNPGFWLIYFVLSAALLILLLRASLKWWWAYLILWLPTATHTICGVHNVTLLLEILSL